MHDEHDTPSGGDKKTPPTTHLQPVVDLVRHCVARRRTASQHFQTSTNIRVIVDAVPLPLFAIPPYVSGGGASLRRSATFPQALCLLCGVQEVCRYLSGFPGPDNPPDASRLSTITPRDMCAECFMKIYMGVIRPAIAADGLSLHISDSLKRLADTMKNADAAAAAAVKRMTPLAAGARWTCPRCMYSANMNGATDGVCAACGGPAPHLSSCVDCGVMLTPDTIGKPCIASIAQDQSMSMSQSSGVGVSHLRRHVPWECPRCTFINTTDTETCHGCHETRAWICSRCNAPNTSRRGSMGERDCFYCGCHSIDLGASTAVRMGMDPEAILKERAQQDTVMSGLKRLDERLKSTGLVRRSQQGDGNCQFRSIAQQLFRSPELHMLVRHMVVEHMLRTYETHFAHLFTSKEEFSDYTDTMRVPQTWGDELTLRAAADVFACRIMVVTSDIERWLMTYEPPHSTEGPVPVVVLAYQRPVHYDDVTADTHLALPRCADLASLVAATLGAIEAEEAQWEDAGADFNCQDEWIDVRLHYRCR